MHSVRVPINVRCYSNSAIIIRRSAVTLRAMKRLMHCSKQHGYSITSSVRASNEQWLNPLVRKERPHFLQETGKGGFILKDKVIAAR